MTAIGSPSDSLSTLREYRHLAPWNLHDLVAVAGAILEATGITPINAAATASPSERTVRFYVTRGLMTPPDGRGTSATYGYRHLLQLLGIKLRQMEGATLQQIEIEMGQTTGDVLERRVAAVLGPSVPAPSALDLTTRGHAAAGRSRRVFHSPEVVSDSARAWPGSDTAWYRIPVSSGIELHVNGHHPLARQGHGNPELARAVRAAIASLLDASEAGTPAPSPDHPSEPGEPEQA